MGIHRRWRITRIYNQVYGALNVSYDAPILRGKLYFVAQKISAAIELTPNMNYLPAVDYLCVATVISFRSPVISIFVKSHAVWPTTIFMVLQMKTSSNIEYVGSSV